MQRLKGWALRRADYLIAVQRDMASAALGQAADRLRQAVIPMGVDLARFTPGPQAEARRRLGWPQTGLCVLYPTDPAKAGKRPELARAGFERWRRGLEDEAERARARLVVGGDIDYALMPDAIRAGDAVLVTSDYEASPTVVKEALACERPVVSTDVGDVREAYGGLAGVRICDWTAESVAAALGQALAVTGPLGGRERLRELELGLDQVARRVEAVYRRVLGQPAGGPDDPEIPLPPGVRQG
jgi:hypothetical protein